MKLRIILQTYLLKKLSADEVTQRIQNTAFQKFYIVSFHIKIYQFTFNLFNNGSRYLNQQFEYT